MIKGTMTGIWKAANEKWKRRYCGCYKIEKDENGERIWDEEEFQEKLKFTYSITIKCGSCDKDVWMQVTTPQIEGKEPIICIFNDCKAHNYIYEGKKASELKDDPPREYCHIIGNFKPVKNDKNML